MRVRGSIGTRIYLEAGSAARACTRGETKGVCECACVMDCQRSWVWVCGALAVELDVSKVHVKVGVLVVVVLRRDAKGKGGVGERGPVQVGVISVVEHFLHATVLPGHGLVEIEFEVILAVEVLHEVAAIVAGEARRALARGRPAVQRVLDDDGVLVRKIKGASKLDAVQTCLWLVGFVVLEVVVGWLA